VRLPRLTPTTREVLLAAGLTVAVELELALSGDLWKPARGLAALLITLPVAFRLRRPVAALVGVVAGVVVMAALGSTGFTGPVFPAIAVLLSLYAVGSRTRGSTLAFAAIVSLGGLFAAGLLVAADPGGSFAVALVVTAGGLVWAGRSVCGGTNPRRSMSAPLSSYAREMSMRGPLSPMSENVSPASCTT
jgi:hypothetical protein